MSFITNKLFKRAIKFKNLFLSRLCLFFLFLFSPKQISWCSSGDANYPSSLSSRVENYHPTVESLCKESEQLGKKIEFFSKEFEKTRREISDLDLRLVEISEKKNDSQKAFDRLDLYINSHRTPVDAAHLSYGLTEESDNISKISVDIIGQQCTDFINLRKKAIEDLLPQVQDAATEYAQLKITRQEWLKKNIEESDASVFARLTESEFELKVRYLQRQVDLLHKQLEYSTALLVYKECFEQIYRYPASNTIILQLREKIQQRLPNFQKEENIKKQIESWTNFTIEHHSKFRQNLEDLAKYLSKSKEFFYQRYELSKIENEIEQWTEKNSRILHEIETDEECLNQVIERCKKLVTQYCLWMQDCLPLKFYLKKSVFRDCDRMLVDFFRAVLKIKGSKAIFFILLTVFFECLIVLSLTPWIRASKEGISKIEEGLGRVTKDSILLTLQTLLWNGLVSLFWPLMFAAPFISLWILNPGSSSLFALTEAGLFSSLWCYFFLFIKKMGSSQGIFESHLRFSKKKINEIFSGWHLQVTIFCTSYFIFHYFSLLPLEALNIVFSRIAFISMVLSSAWLKWKLGRSNIPVIPLNQSLSQPNYFNVFFWFISTLIALYSAAAATKGFFETAKIIFWCLEKLILLLGGLLLIYQLIVRAMLVHRRKISFERNLQKRTELLEKISKKGEEIDDATLKETENSIDLETVSSRALSLLCSISQIFGLFLFWIICPEIQPMLSRLDVHLLGSSLTLFDVLKLLIALFSFYQFYRYLPSALDLLVFPNFKLTQNTRYTIKLLTRYAIFTIGLIFFYKKIQGEASESLKLVNTLILGGLGFGIRDIFNSVVSGIIILTLKTIQVGDTLNVGNITGVVTQVTILSTIVIDAEKKELSIPNKNIINELFSRWPSEDLVNRISFKISVPSRCSSKIVFEVLKEAAQAIAGVSQNHSDDNTSIISISKGILTYELILLVEDLQHQALIKTSLYEQILERAPALGISQDEISISS